MYIGVDIGGTKCAVITADGQGRIQSRTAFATGSVEETLERIIREIDSAGACTAIGLSCGGPLNEKTGRILSPPNLPGWDDVPVTDILTERFGVPAHLRNDANAGALAEWRFGAGRGMENLIFLTFGTGMGAGLILNGRLYSGTNGNAGEVGHVRLERFGPVGYGKTGSFEGFCSGGGIRQIGQTLARERIQQGRPPTFCKTPEDLDRIDARLLKEYAEQGEETALKAYALCAEKLGMGLAMLIDILNPEAIILGSIFARARSLLTERMERIIREEALPFSSAVCKILPAELGEKIGDYAALAAAME